MVAPGNASWTIRSPRPRVDVRRAALGIGADAGDQHEASDTCSSRLTGKRLRALLMHGLESYAASLDVGRDRVDDGVRPSDSASNSTSVTHVGAEEINPFHVRRTKSASRLVGMPNCDAHGRPLGGEPADDSPAEETRATKNANRGHSMAAICGMRLSTIAEYRFDEWNPVSKH